MRLSAKLKSGIRSANGDRSASRPKLADFGELPSVCLRHELRPNVAQGRRQSSRQGRVRTAFEWSDNESLWISAWK